MSDCFISVDVETAGPDPSRYALLSIGACTVLEPVTSFYIELAPTSEQVQPEALRVSGLSWEKLKAEGHPPEAGMRAFADWLEGVTPPGSRPVFVAFNAPFDWMFVNHYFHTYLGRNPFGHSALDMKAYFMGLTGHRWAATGMRDISRYFLAERVLSHHALQDALDQAEIFRRMLAEARPAGHPSVPIRKEKE